MVAPKGMDYTSDATAPVEPDGKINEQEATERSEDERRLNLHFVIVEASGS